MYVKGTENQPQPGQTNQGTSPADVGELNMAQLSLDYQNWGNEQAANDYQYTPLKLQEDMLAQSHAMYDPYRQAAMGAWGDYTGMTTGGEANMAPMSQQYQMEIGRGGQAIDRGMASRGALNSSGRDAAYGDMLMNAGQGEAARQYSNQLDMQRLGTGALQGLGSAGQQAGANVSGIYSNQGQVANAMYQNQGANTAANYNMAGNAIAGMGQYFG